MTWGGGRDFLSIKSSGEREERDNHFRFEEAEIVLSP
jgi:hypothetical protein